MHLLDAKPILQSHEAFGNTIPSHQDDQTFHHTVPTYNIENEIPKQDTLPTNIMPSHQEIHNLFDNTEPDNLHNTLPTNDIPSHEETHNAFNNNENDPAADHIHNTIPTNDIPTNIVSHLAIPGKVGGKCVASGQLENGQHIIKG